MCQFCFIYQFCAIYQLLDMHLFHCMYQFYGVALFQGMYQLYVIDQYISLMVRSTFVLCTILCYIPV